MTKEEILTKWKDGLSKNMLAKIYKREHNQQIKIIRSELRNRHSGKFITTHEALKEVETVIYEYIKYLK